MLQRLSGQSDNRKIAPAEAIVGRGDSCFRGPVGQSLILRNGMDRGLTAGLLLLPFAERFVHFLLFLFVVLFRVSLHLVDEMVDLIAEILIACSVPCPHGDTRLVGMASTNGTRHEDRSGVMDFEHDGRDNRP